MGRHVNTPQEMLSKVTIDGDCFRWNGVKDKDGYGLSSIKGKKIPAHRAHWILTNGELTSDQYVLHKCKHRDCINLDHLYVGTQKQNIGDQIAADTFVRGSKNGKARLVEDQVLSIRSSTLSCSDLAKQYNYSYYGMWDILKGRSWKDLL